MTPREVWCNEAQERYVLAIAPGVARPLPRALRARALPVRRGRRGDRGAAPRGARPALRQQAGGHGPAGAARQAAADDARRRPACGPTLPPLLARRASTSREAHRAACCAPRRWPTRRSSSRSATGRSAASARATRWWVRGRCRWPTARRRCWPSRRYAGEAFAIGERTPLAVIDAPASGRMAVAEALTNLAAAPGAPTLSRVKLSANWMAAAGSPARTRRCSTRCARSPLDLCPRARRQHPGRQGLDVDAHRVAWKAGATQAVVSPLSLIVSAFAPCDDVRGTLTPQLRTDCGPTVARSGGPRAGARRVLAARCWRRCSARRATRRRTSTTRPRSGGLYAALAELRARGLVLAYHDRSDGGLFVTLCEMALRRPRRRHRSTPADCPARTPTCSPRCSPRSSARSCRCATADARRGRSTCCARHGVSRPHRRRGRTLTTR